MGNQLSNDCPEGFRPNRSRGANDTIGPGLFTLALCGGLAILLLTVVNVLLPKLNKGAKAGLNAVSIIMFLIPAIYYIRLDPSEYAPRSINCINDNLEFTNINYWPRIWLFTGTCVCACLGCCSYLGLYAAKHVQAEFHEDDIESFDPRTHVYR